MRLLQITETWKCANIVEFLERSFQRRRHCRSSSSLNSEAQRYSEWPWFSNSFSGCGFPSSRPGSSLGRVCDLRHWHGSYYGGYQLEHIGQLPLRLLLAFLIIQAVELIQLGALTRSRCKGLSVHCASEVWRGSILPTYGYSQQGSDAIVYRVSSTKRRVRWSRKRTEVRGRDDL